ncbi:transposase [bacterium]|nr:MAG: transposase [bacterium]
MKERIVASACEYGRCGYRRVTGFLSEGCRVNHKRVELLWCQEGLKVPQRQPKRKRLCLNDGSRASVFVRCIATTFGAMILSQTGPATEDRSGCRALCMSIHESV